MTDRLSASGRWGLRARLVAAVAVGGLIALGGLLIAFNLVLAAQLNGDANDLARARAAAQISALRVSGGRIELPEAADARTADSRVWVFAGGRALEAPAAPAVVDRTARRLAPLAPRYSDVAGTETRLYAAPVGQGRPIGAVVVAVDLGAYAQTRRTALIASALLAAVVLALAVAATRWLIGRALAPVATMTRQASQWSEHDLGRRFAPGPRRDEIALLAQTLNGLLERLGASLRHEQRLSSEISHELRTPLASLIAEAQSARRHGGDDETLARILRSAQQLRATLDTLMSAARAQFTPGADRADALACARAAVDAARGSVRAEVSVTVAGGRPPTSVAANAGLVERILAPLIENAMRHAETSVLVTVSREDDAVCVTVADDGPGVAAVDRAEIFAPGYRSTLTRPAEGAGLGLALCRRLAASAGGDVRLEASEAGARFSVRLPSAA